MSAPDPQTIANAIATDYPDTLCHMRFHGACDHYAPGLGPEQRKAVFNALPAKLRAALVDAALTLVESRADVAVK